MNFGCARVSAKDQHLDTQLDQLTAAGGDRVFQEKISGATIQRPVLTELLATLRAGDTVTVARLNRLGRSSAHIMQLVAELHERQVRFVALDLGIDTATPAGRPAGAGHLRRPGRVRPREHPRAGYGRHRPSQSTGQASGPSPGRGRGQAGQGAGLPDCRYVGAPDRGCHGCE